MERKTIETTFYVLCVQIIKNNNYKLYDFTKNSLFISYKEYSNNTIYNNLLTIPVNDMN